eukprot:GDKI01024075.1.p2 GENE.GDKI01024075.1~~GDKI01024075.1.p2  ORF type:complete len:110 (+),score=24.97 GDKI01024075.1:90-419(+)
MSERANGPFFICVLAFFCWGVVAVQCVCLFVRFCFAGVLNERAWRSAQVSVFVAVSVFVSVACNQREHVHGRRVIRIRQALCVFLWTVYVSTSEYCRIHFFGACVCAID